MTIKIIYLRMKRIVSSVVIFMIIGISLSAQEYKNSVGIRAGIPLGFTTMGHSGATIKHFFNKTNAIEGIVSSYGIGTSIAVTGLFQDEHWTGIYPGINWYWGIGAHMGYMDAKAATFLPSSFKGGGVMGLDVVLGVEYTFDEIPLNISVDIMPNLNLVGYVGPNFFVSGISARYVF
jgi:hypothetical protein